jgi:hypothetical protein
LREVLAEEGMDAQVKLIAVNTDEEARRLRFPGSPRFGLTGKTVPRRRARGLAALGCRVHATPEGLKGSPTTERLRKALTKEGAADARLHR